MKRVNCQLLRCGQIIYGDVQLKNSAFGARAFVLLVQVFLKYACKLMFPLRVTTESNVICKKMAYILLSSSHCAVV